MVDGWFRKAVKQFFTFDEGLGWQVVGIAIGVAWARVRPNISITDAVIIAFIGFGILVYCRSKKLRATSDNEVIGTKPFKEEE